MKAEELKTKLEAEGAKVTLKIILQSVLKCITIRESAAYFSIRCGLFWRLNMEGAADMDENDKIVEKLREKLKDCEICPCRNWK